VYLSVVCGVSAQSVAPARPPAPPDAAGAAQAPNYSSEAFIIERARATYRFENDGTGRRESFLRVKTQSEAGVQAWGQLVFGYNAANEKLDVQFVRVLKSDGSVVTAPADAVQDLSSPVERVAPVYTDFRQKHVTVPGLRPGETLEFSFVATLHTAVAAGQFWTEYDFQTENIVLDEQLQIDVPAARVVTLKTRAGAEPVISESDGRKLYRWTRSNRAKKQQKKEGESPEPGARQGDEPEPPAVRLTTFQSWAEVGRWYAGLEAPSRALTPEIRRKAADLTAGKTTEMAKLEALYDFVAPNFRYVSLSLGVGRYQPRPAVDVLRDQYGDCKDKHTLLASLAESVGLRVSTVLINSTRKIDPTFPSPSQFDHAISRAVADGRDVWLDVTTEIAPFQLLSMNLRKKQALVIASGAARLEETPPDPPVPNTESIELTGKLGDLGRLAGRVRLTVRGDYELLFRTIFRRTPAAQWKDVVESMNTSAGLSGDVSDWKITEPADTHSAFAIEYQVAKASLLDWTKAKADLKLPFASISLPGNEEVGTGDQARIELGSPKTNEYKLSLELSPDYKARVPLPVSVSRDYAEYRSTYTMSGNTFSAARKLQIRARDIPASRATDYAAFRRVVTADAAQVLALDRAPGTASNVTPADLTADELFKSGSDAVRNGNYEQAVELFTRLLAVEPKHKTARNYLGFSYYNLRKLDASIAAFTDQVAINAYDEYAYGHLGLAYMQLRRYAEAESAFRKQLEINPLEKRAHGNLARLYIDTKRYSGAVAELEQGIKLNPDDASHQVELGTALLNLARNDDALAAFEKASNLEPNPTTWNNIAYQLSLKAVHLDRAQRYAESAVSAVVAESRNFTIDRVTSREFGIVRSLAAYWDTLGWVHFAKGDLARAEQLVAASWQLGQSAEVGDHLAQIFEKRGQKDDAVRLYALAMNADRPLPETRDRLNALVGNPQRADAAIRILSAELVRMRTTTIEAGSAGAGTADFVILIGQGSVAEAVKFITGDASLRTLSDAVLKANFGTLIPADSSAKLLRRATVTCAAPAPAAKNPVCTLTLLTLAETRP
jgi:tetratricopeptide (TPR) repeat protein